MIQKKKLIELIKHRLEGESETKNLGKLHPVVIEYNIGRTYNTLVTDAIRRNVDNADTFAVEYQSVAISQDASTEIYYSTLPANIIIIPKKAESGVVTIQSMTNRAIQFVPITNGQWKVMDGLEVDSIDDVVGYTFKNGRVEYYNMTSTIALSAVRMELVLPFEEYDDDDDVPIQSGYDDLLFEQVVKKLIGLPDSDNLNNNNSLNVNSRRRQ